MLSYLLFLQIFTNMIVAASSNESLPHFKNSAELSNFVRKSIDQDLETLNLLDRAMAAPINHNKKSGRRLRTQQSSDTSKKNKVKQRNLSLFGDDEEENLSTNPMIDAINNLESKVDPEGMLKSDSRRSNRQND